MRLSSWISIIALSVAACAPTGADGPSAAGGTAQVERYAGMQTAELWRLHGAPASTQELFMVEAELGTRGQTNSGGAYIGQRTTGTVGRSLYARTGSASGDMNCSDFPSAAAAQRFFLSEGGPLRDPHGLDRDGDGNACEWGTRLTSNARAHRAPQRVTQARPSYRTYHRGPRGGCYYWSGNSRQYVDRSLC